MSVLVNGMEMPKNCHNCELSIRTEVTYGTVYVCQILNEVIGNVMVRQIHCPLVELPTPHGDLIDTNDVQSAIDCWLIDEDDATIQDYKDAISEILESPTVVPAEEDE